MHTLDTDILVMGGNPGGIAAAIQAAKYGFNIILISHTRVLGGFFPSLGAFETHYRGNRSSFNHALEQKVIAYYKETYGEASQAYIDCTTLEPNNPMITFEPHVMEHILEQTVAAEPKIRVLRGYYPVEVTKNEKSVIDVKLQSFETNHQLTAAAKIFIDASSEGDLMALAGAEYRVGRESRDEFGESHAGKIFTTYVKGLFPKEAVEGKLNLIPKWSTLSLLPGSTGEGDDNIQDYSYRLCLSSDPDNRWIPDSPPESYDRSMYSGISEKPEDIYHTSYSLHHRYLNHTIEDQAANDHVFHGHKLPNRKRSWNATNFTEAGKTYPEADWPTRRIIEQHHLNHALGIMWFLQNDLSVPEHVRSLSKEWGLAKDEFRSNNLVPHQMYVRESRRLIASYILKEHDFLCPDGWMRPPIHNDSIAITDFPLDSLPCTKQRVPGSLPDGQFFMQDQTRPGQVPYRVMISNKLDNVLITETCAATHVAWGTVRQTPVLIQLGEAAGIAAALCMIHDVSPAKLNIDLLQQTLIEKGLMLTFFNDVDMSHKTLWLSAIQYFGTKGFFPSFDANPEQPVTKSVAKEWVAALKELAYGRQDTMSIAKAVIDAEQRMDGSISHAEWIDMFEELNQAFMQEDLHLSPTADYSGWDPTLPVTRGDMCTRMYEWIRQQKRGGQ
ncbi:FAD-dependent oxidoreductase [Paenibacillus koleovorans]|uniref:FAD-dependent oxidoreductase n=1 Tax=Paenibacillus koleovorans TaxID=121608 RepID=UPI000FD82AAD|nr:FAD-dependent oxidoreductase [Paenibacillus koleovorans]